MKLTRERSLFEIANSSAQAAMIRAAHVVALEIDRGITSMLLIHSEPQMRQFWSQQSATTQRNIINAAHAEALEVNAAHDRAELESMDFLHGEAMEENDRFDRLMMRYCEFCMVLSESEQKPQIVLAHTEALEENARFDRLANRHYVFWMGTAANDRAAWLAQDHADALAQDAINNAWEKVNQ